MMLNHLAPTTRPATETAVLESPAVVIEPLDVLEPLKTVTNDGDFVHRSQTMASKRGFSHVSEGWAERADNPDDTTVMTYEQALEHLETERGTIRDIEAPYDRLRPVVDFVTRTAEITDEVGNVQTETRRSWLVLWPGFDWQPATAADGAPC